MTARLTPGSLALLRGQPFIPPVRIEMVQPLLWGGTRYHFRHEAPGFGRSPQHDDGPRRLIPVPAEYVAPPSAAEGREALAGWLVENTAWLVPTFGARCVGGALADLYQRTASAKQWAGIAREIIAGRADPGRAELRREAA